VRSRSALYGGVAARGTLARTKVEVYGSATIPGETAARQHALKDVAAVNPFPGDPATTPRLFAYSSAKLRNADLLSLQSEATRETAGSWAHKADLYFIAVTLLAVVLALLGLMASIRQGFGPWLYVAVGLLTAAALISALLAAFTSVTDTPQEAWNAVADGNARLAVADYRGAVKAYDRALELREDYVTALRQRAPARVAADSVAVGIYVISNSTPEAYEQATRDLQRAIDNGAEDFLTLTNQGAFLFHLRQYRRSEDLSRKALAIQELPLPMANLGLVIAAQGREQEAAQTYRRFIGLVEAQAARGRDPIEREELYSSSLTTLEKLARLEPARAPLVLRLQGMLTAAWASHKAEPAMGSGQAQGTLRLAASQTGFAAKLRYSGVMPGDPTAWAVYYRARGAMTGSTSGSCRTSGCGTWWPTGPPGLHRSTGPVSRPATCGSTSWLPAGAWPRPRPNAAPCPPGSSRSLTAAPACPGVGPPPGR
jgi:tetratricopeptide (TPR) repeat protein